MVQLTCGTQCLGVTKWIFQGRMTTQVQGLAYPFMYELRMGGS